VLETIDNLAGRVVAIAAGCRDREPDQLSDQERLALAIIGGCELEFTGTGVRAKNPFGIQKIDGRWIVREKRS
jgi:hypothetical protein